MSVSTKTRKYLLTGLSYLNLDRNKLAAVPRSFVQVLAAIKDQKEAA